MHSGCYGVSPTDLSHGQRCWGRGTHRAGAAWGGGLGITLLPQDKHHLKGAPRAALAQPFPHSSGVTWGAGAGREGLSSWDGQSWLGGSSSPRPRTWMLSPQTTRPQRCRDHGLGGFRGSALCWGQGKESCRWACREDPHPPERPNLACFSHTGL